MEVRKGKILGIVGPNGTGKTTLITCAARIIRPDSGRVYLDNTDIARLTRPALPGKLDTCPSTCPPAFLDEPTSSLDLYHQLEVMELVATLVRQKTLGAMMAMHDLTLAGRFADDLLMMRNGTVFCHGCPTDLLTPGRIREVYGVEATVHRQNGHVFVHPLQCADNRS